MRTKQEIENNAFEVNQRLIHYDIGENLQVYNLVATARRIGGNGEGVVKNTFGICFTDELQYIHWFSDFQTRAKNIIIVKKMFQKAYAKLHFTFPEFEEVLNAHIITPENFFKTLEINNGHVEDFILIEYDVVHEMCRFYKEHSCFEDRWMPHLEPFNHKAHMTTNKEYDLKALYEYLLRRRDVVIPNGIEVVNNIFKDETLYVLNFYVRIDNIHELHEEIFEDLPKEVIDIEKFKLHKEQG